MQRLNKSQMKQKFEELYFNKLEDDGVDFTELNDIGNGQTESLIKDEYIETVENMIDYIWGLDDWVGQWTLDLYNSANDEVETDTEFGTVEINNNKESYII